MRQFVFTLSAIIAWLLPAYICGYKVGPEQVTEVNESASANLNTEEILIAAPKSGEEVEVSVDSLFEKAVDIIKSYESLHKASNWPYVGYGHRVRKGDNYKQGVALTEKEADKLLRKDLREYVDMYQEYGKDAVLLAALAYNCGHGRVDRSTVLKKIKAGDRDIRDAYLSHARSGGKFRKQLYERRVVELSALYIP